MDVNSQPSNGTSGPTPFQNFQNMFQNFNLGYPEGFLYLKGQKSHIVHGVKKVTPKGVGGNMNCYHYFSQGHPHQKVRKSQEIPGWDRHMILLSDMSDIMNRCE